MWKNILGGLYDSGYCLTGYADGSPVLMNEKFSNTLSGTFKISLRTMQHCCNMMHLSVNLVKTKVVTLIKRIF